MSDNALQKQKAVWLETRAKLNTMLDDVTSWIKNIQVKESFKDMNALYEARNNIVKKLNNLTKPKPWLLNPSAFTKKLIWYWLAWAWLEYLWLKHFTP